MAGEHASGCGWDLWRDAAAQEDWRRVMARAMQTSRKGVGPDDESMFDAIREPRFIGHDDAREDGVSWSRIWRESLLAWWGARYSWNSAGRSSIVLGKCARMCSGGTIFWRDRKGRGFIMKIGSLGGMGHDLEKSVQETCFPVCASCNGKLNEV